MFPKIALKIRLWLLKKLKGIPQENFTLVYGIHPGTLLTHVKSMQVEPNVWHELHIPFSYQENKINLHSIKIITPK